MMKVNNINIKKNKTEKLNKECPPCKKLKLFRNISVAKIWNLRNKQTLMYDICKQINEICSRLLCVVHITMMPVSSLA